MGIQANKFNKTSVQLETNRNDRNMAFTNIWKEWNKGHLHGNMKNITIFNICKNVYSNVMGVKSFLRSTSL
jgi:hypothetical protein